MALAHHPRIAAARLNAQAAGATVAEAKSALQPLLIGNLTSVGADNGTSIAAGTIQTSGLASRAATGLGITQLVTDFGRTANLISSARFRASAQDRAADLARTQVLLQVEQAYYNALSADAVLQVAKARLEMQRLTLRQVSALAESGLKSTLDVSFAEVTVSEAELALDQADNAAKSSRALLMAAIGEEDYAPYSLADVPVPGRITATPEQLVTDALKDRPDLAAARLNQTAAERYAEAEHKLKYPAISVVGVLGVTPIHQSGFADQYSAAGLNISLPFLNGGLYAARRQEAEFRARSAEKEAQALGVQIAGNVRAAWFDADTAWRRIDVTARLVDQTTRALRLARTRYEIGLSGILELTQAQLSLTSAQISEANAKYDYLSRVAALNYLIGAIR